MALDFTPDDRIEALRRNAHAAFTPLTSLRAEIRARSDEEGWYPEPVWQALAQSGALGAVIPEAYGGGGTGVLGLTTAVEEMAAADVGNTLPVLTSLAALCVARHGTEPLKTRVLPEVAAGRRKLCFAATEAEAGFNVFRTRTAARRDGDDFTLDGEKLYISGADVADAMLVVARTTSAEDSVAQGLGKTYGISLFLVDRASPGISLERIDSRGEGVMRQYRVHYDGVRVPAERLIGDENAGALALLTCFNPERVMMASLVIGMTTYCLDVACRHARERKVFGSKAIGSYQAIQHPLAEALLRREALRLVVQKAAWLLDRDADPKEAALYANAAKILGAELAIGAVDSAIDALGGAGFRESSGLLRLWQAARLFKTSPISNALALNFVAEHHLELPRST